jgi:hypothetical protein
MQIVYLDNKLFFISKLGAELLNSELKRIYTRATNKHPAKFAHLRQIFNLRNRDELKSLGYQVI